MGVRSGRSQVTIDSHPVSFSVPALTECPLNLAIPPGIGAMSTDDGHANLNFCVTVDSVTMTRGMLV